MVWPRCALVRGPASWTQPRSLLHPRKHGSKGLASDSVRQLADHVALDSAPLVVPLVEVEEARVSAVKSELPGVSVELTLLERPILLRGDGEFCDCPAIEVYDEDVGLGANGSLSRLCPLLRR